MEKFRVQNLFLTCEELGISADSAKTKEAAPDVMKAEEVTVEEADDARETIEEKKHKAECERREREETGKRKQEAARQHALRIEEIEQRIQTRRWQIA